MADAGWYNDTSDPTLARWHDGVSWTDHAVLKAEWEAIGHEPPPPEEDPEPVGVGRVARLWAVAGAAALVGTVVVGGALLDRDGGGDPAGSERTTGESDAADRVRDDADLPQLPFGSVDDGLLDEDGSAPSDTDPAGGTTATTRRSGSGTTPTSAPLVRRTETSTNTQRNTTPITATGRGDQTSVGNTSSKTIKDQYVPPPTTTVDPNATTTTAAPVEESTTTTAP